MLKDFYARQNLSPTVGHLGATEPTRQLWLNFDQPVQLPGSSILFSKLLFRTKQTPCLIIPKAVDRKAQKAAAGIIRVLFVI